MNVPVGKQPPPKIEYRYLVTVRRERVRKALQWLVANNPLYAPISISDENLETLPEDDIPGPLWDTRVEVTETAKQFRDVDGSSYVNDLDSDDDCGEAEDIFYVDPTAGVRKERESKEQKAESKDELFTHDRIPVTTSGLCDVKAGAIHASEVDAAAEASLNRKHSCHASWAWLG